MLPTALEKRIGVLINLPFGGRRDGNLFSRVGGRELPEWAAEIDARSWGQFFLKYVVSHPAVTAAIPGMTKVASSRRQPRCAARTHAGRRNARAHGEVLGPELRHLSPRLEKKTPAKRRPRGRFHREPDYLPTA